MIVDRNVHVKRSPQVVIDVDARCGRGWALTVQSARSVRVRVLLQWAGGERELVNMLTIDGPNDIALPARLTGRRLEVEITRTAGAFAVGAQAPKRAVAAVCLAWTPDVACHAPDEGSCQ